MDQVPAAWIDSAKVKIKLHYAHTSHGRQITIGFSRIESQDAFYDHTRGTRSSPTDSGTKCIFDGQEHDSYITPDEYWETAGGMNYTRDVLTNNPEINVSMWSWCIQVNGISELHMQDYVDSIAVLESAFPEVIFVYMTRNAQNTGSSGYNRSQRNDQLRNYCIENNKVLFDFSDLDSWYFDAQTETWDQATTEYDGHTFPVEHAMFNGNEAGHTTYLSCEQQGRAAWYLAAVLAGWEGTTSVIDGDQLKAPKGFTVSPAYPNPFNPSTTISYSLNAPAQVSIRVYDITGQLIRTIKDSYESAGQYRVQWHGYNQIKQKVVSGFYFVVIQAYQHSITQKIALIQ